MVKIRSCVQRMTGYVPGESSEDPDVVKLNQNENRYPPSAKALAAMTEAMPLLSIYPESTSLGLRRAAAESFGVEPEQVIAANGSDEMLLMLFQACCDPGDEVVGFNPSYTFYATLAAKADVRYRLIDFEGEYRLPAKLDLAGAKLVFLPNPNAPTGTLFPESEIRRLLAAMPDGILVLDEAYADYSGQTLIPLIREYDNLVVTRTFSKSYSLAGLRVGLGFANAPLLAQLEKIRDFYNLDRLAQAGAEAAMRDREWLAETTRKIVATRDRTIPAIRALGLKAYDSASNFILVRFASPEQAEGVFRHLRENRVLVRYFKSRGLSDCLRVSVGTDADMEIFLKKLRSALHK